MIMESPVRICLGAVLVVNLLLLSSTTVSGDALPHDNSSTTIKDERPGRLTRVNNTAWIGRNRPKTADVALNELNGKDSTSEENTDKNVKYKQRGRVRFGAKPPSTTETPVRRGKTTSTEAAAKIIIVTPTPEVKKPTQIMNSMRVYKKTKMPAVSSSTIASFASESEEHEYESEKDDEVDSYEKFTTGKFDDSSFFTIPNYSKENSKSEKDWKTQTVSTFTSYSPKTFPGPKDNSKDEPYKSEFFDFSIDLTTPRNEFFDKKFQEISSNIKKNLDAIKIKSSKNTTGSQKVIKQNVDLQKLNSGSPNNKSTVIFKNTKEIRLSDNESAGSANKELSDVQGTSIYYEMSVLSTETYAINNSNEDDCDNETVPDPTVPSKVELVTAKPTQSSFASGSTRNPYPDPDIANVLHLSTTIPESSSTASLEPVAAQNTISPTETAKVMSSGYRNRSYSKRLNLTGAKESNSVTPKTDQTAGQSYRQNTRKFHYTTPKVKPIWMAPRRNVTRTSSTRKPVPSTIYSEHFDISDKYTTTSRPNTSNRTMLTTVSSEIDPIVQGDDSGVKKVVHSHSIADNSIPSVWKRGSTKFSSSTEPPRDTESGVSDLEIPPTLTAWALASLRSPPSMASPVTNVTRTIQKNIDENELQKVGEVTDKKNGDTIPVTTPTSVTLSNDLVSKTLPEIHQNKLNWKPLDIPTTTMANDQADERNESTSESLPAESNISVKSSVQPSTESINEINKKEFKPSWIPVTEKVKDQVAAEQTQETIPPVDATKSTGFESITKLPAGTKTPQDETVANFIEETNVPTTTDYEITTIRFSYVPTEEATEINTVENATDTMWHPVFPTRTKVTTIKDEPITTYRPKYVTDSEEVSEPTTYVPETTSQIKVTSPKASMVSESVSSATKSEPMTTDTIVTEPMTTKSASEEPTTSIPEETTRVTFEVVTEIQKDVNTSPVTEPSETETPPSEIRESSSEENSGSNEVITLKTTKVVPPIPPVTTAKSETTSKTTTEVVTETTERITTLVVETTPSEKIVETTKSSDNVETTTEEEIEMTKKSVNELEDLTNYGEEVTTEASTRLVTDEAGSGAAIAIAVSTIGVIALILLVGLLLVARKRSRRGVYAQRCTPVSLDAYSLDSVSVGHRKGNQRLRASKRSYGNPAYDDEVTSHPMQYAALSNFAMDVESVTAEFAEIPSVSVRPDEVPPGCEDKNRYSNVLPLPETRVPLKRIGDDPTSEYINANFIMGPGNIRNYYIACQAPMANTVSDFWRMIWEQNSRLIVMLTEYMENGVEKCYEYLPPSEVSDNKRTFGEFQVILKKREQRDKYAISSVQLINLNSRTWREITQLWYFWPAKGVPDDYDSVIDFLSEMRSYMKISQTAKEYDEDGVEVIYGDQSRSSYGNLSKLRSDENGSGNGLNVYSPAKAEEQLRRNTTNGTLGRMKAASEVESVRPCTVTCASGAGRSAAMIAADICARALCAGRADVPRAVRELRQQRPHSLHNRMHYVFLYKLLSEYGNKLMGGGVDTI